MWPNIERMNKIGIKFEEDFWNIWGPSKMFYFNPELFNDEKEIKSIYFRYLPHNRINFDPNEIAMGLIYECSEFGEHTVLFSYEEVPHITHEEYSWNHYVLPYIETDDDLLINLYNDKNLQLRGEITESEMYIRYLEDLILDYNGERESFRILSKNILNEYICLHPIVEPNQAYQILLESLALRVLNSDNTWQIRKSICKCCKTNHEDFDRIICEIMKMEKNEDLMEKGIKDKYQRDVDMLNFFKLENNLNSIYRNCRDLFLDNVIQYRFDKDTDNKVYGYEGKVIKGDNEKALFEEAKLNSMTINTNKAIPNFNDSFFDVEDVDDR